ncbi:MAG: hypothetical protein P8Y70_09015 [Candidatus Lokiarchaeota archaeon]
MRDLKKYMYAFPLVSAILSIIAILTPTAGTDLMGLMMMYIWMWGLFYISIAAIPPASSGITLIEFTSNYSLLAFSIFCTIIIILSIILLVISTVRLKNGRNMDTMMIISSTILIAISIIYIIGVEIIFSALTAIPGITTGISISIWSILNPSFGIIGPIIAGIVGIAGALIDKFYVRKLKPEVKESNEGLYKERKIQPDVEEVGKNFCPECGSKLEKEDLKFCSNCGYNLSDI